MGMKPPLVVLSFVLYASGSSVLAGEEALVPDTAAATQAQPVALAAPATVSQDMHDAMLMSPALLGPSWAGPIALSDSERLQLRDEIRRAAQDIYAEPHAHAAGQDATRAVVNTVSP